MKANLNGMAIHYGDVGTGPAILVLHDGPSNRDMEKRFAPLAQTGYRIIVTHLDGLGKKKPADLDISACSRNTVALLSFLGIGRAVVFGVGLGGIVLLDLLDASPGRVAASSLVLGSATAKEIRQLADRPDIHAALNDGRFADIKKEFLAILPLIAREKTSLGDLPRLQGWIDGVRSRNHYLSAIHHRSALLADMELPPLIVESEEGNAKIRAPRKSSLASRGWKKLRGVNAHLAALLQFLSPQEEDLDEQEPLSDLR